MHFFFNKFPNDMVVLLTEKPPQLQLVGTKSFFYLFHQYARILVVNSGICLLPYPKFNLTKGKKRKEKRRKKGVVLDSIL